MPERVVAFSTSAVRLVRVVTEQAGAGSQVMAAFLNADAARSYLAYHPYRLVGEALDGHAGTPAQAAATAPAPAAAPQPAPQLAAQPAPRVQAAMPAVAEPPAPHALEAMVPRRGQGPGQVIACYSPRGGAGTSLLAAALASRIAQDGALRVLLVDMDLQNGSQAFFFDVSEMKRSSLLGLKPLVDEILARCEGDQSRVTEQSGSVISEEILLAKTFRRDNLHLLCALDDPAAIDDYVDPASHVEALVQVLAANFDVVVLDLPNTVDSFTAPALFRSDRILVVSPEDIPSQVKVARMLNLVLAPMTEARDLNLQERCFLVVSRSGKRKLEVPMPVGVAAALPEDRKFVDAFVEKHQPYGRVADGPYGKAVSQLAQFLGAGAPPAKK